MPFTGTNVTLTTLFLPWNGLFALRAPASPVTRGGHSSRSPFVGSTVE